MRLAHAKQSLIWISVLTGGLLVSAQKEKEEDYRVQTTSELVQLDVAVEKSGGQRVPGLMKDAFKVREDGKLQTLSFFAQEDLPVSIGIVVDQSGSMQPKRKALLEAAREFVRAGNPRDEMFIVNFNDHVNLGLPEDIPFTNNVHLLENAISSTAPEGRTALYDAVILALERVAKGSKERKAIVLVSDGGDNASRHTEKEMMDAADLVQATIYTIGLYSDDDPDRKPGLLRRLASISGGEVYLPDERIQMSEILGHIATEIRSRYSLAYVPSRSKKGSGVRMIQVDAYDSEGHKLVTRARKRYKLPELEAAQ